MTRPTAEPAGVGPEAMKCAIVRIFAAGTVLNDAPNDAPNGEKASVGVGFLVDDRIALTCAHVVADALGLARGAEPPAGALLTVDLPLLPGSAGGGGVGAGEALTASVEYLIPRQPSGAGDVAVLRLGAQVPAARPLRLVEVDGVWNHRAGAFGLPAGRPAGVWHSGVLKAPQASGWIQMNLDPASGGYAVSQGFSGGPVWDETVGGVVGMLAIAERGEPSVSYLIPTDRLAADWPRLRELTAAPSPFRSLAPFEESDEGIFHGRRAESDRVAAAVADKRVTTLIGPSGCGKSSLARAGVLPRRRLAGDVPVVIRPTRGSSPLHALAAALVPLLEPGLTEIDRLAKTTLLAAELAAHGLHDIAPRILARRRAARLLVVIDQFEELLDLPEPDVRAFTAALAGERPPADVAILSTLRADFVESVLANDRLRDLISPTFDSLLPMSPDQLREAITAPVEATPGMRFEDGLDRRILSDTGANARLLPLLAFTLDLLWRAQDRGVLTFQAYDALGGVKGALSAYADRAWAAVDDADKPTARRLLLRLVRMPIGAEAPTRHVVPRRDLGEAEWRVVQRLAASRLIILNTGSDAAPDDALADVESVELAHEVLIASWPVLGRLVQADHAFLAWRESLRHDAGRWDQADQPSDLLPTKAALAGAQQYLPAREAELGDAEREYLRRGRAYQRSRTRRRGAVIASACALVLAAGSGGVIARQQAHNAARSTAITRANDLAAAAQALSADDPGLGAQLAIAAYRSSPTQAATTQLYSALGTPLLDSILGPTNGNVLRVSTQADGPLGAAVDAGGTVHLWNLGNPAHPKAAASFEAGHTGIALAPRTPMLAAGCGKLPGLCLWNVADPAHAVIASHLPLPPAGSHHITSIAVSPDGSLLAAASEDGHTLLWSIAEPAHPTLIADLPDPSTQTVQTGAPLAAVAFGPDSRVLAETINGGSTRLWSVGGAAPPAQLSVIDSGYQDIAFSGHGMLAADTDSALGVWNVEDPRKPAAVQFGGTATVDSQDLQALAVDPNGDTLAYTGTDTTTGNAELCLLSLPAVEQDSSTVPNCVATGFGTFALAYGPSGALLSGGFDDTVRLWRTPPTQIDNAFASNVVADPTSPNGRLLITGPTTPSTGPGSDVADVWDIRDPGDPTLAATLELTAAEESASFLTDTLVLTVAQDGQVTLWNLTDPRHPRRSASLGSIAHSIVTAGFAGVPVNEDNRYDLVAVLGDADTLHLWHITASGAAAEAGSITDDAATDSGGILGDGRTAVVVTKSGFDWWDISDPARPVKVGPSRLTKASTGAGMSGGSDLFAATSEVDPVEGGVQLVLYQVAGGHIESTATVSRTVGPTLAMSSDGHLLAAGGPAGNGLTLWDTTDPRAPRRLASLITAYDINGIAFNAADSLMADWNQQSVQLWNIHDPSAPVLVGSFSPTSYVDNNPVPNGIDDATITSAGDLLVSVVTGGPSAVYLFDSNPATVATQLCADVASRITPAQWQTYAPDIPYENPCPN